LKTIFDRPNAAVQQNRCAAAARDRDQGRRSSILADASSDFGAAAGDD
jgi:hypothetical protein